MTTRDDNPRWLAALLTALPVLLGALWAWAAPPAAPPTHERYGRPVIPAVRHPDPELTARAP